MKRSAQDQVKKTHKHFYDSRTFKDGFRHCAGCGAALVSIDKGKEIWDESAKIDLRPDGPSLEPCVFCGMPARWEEHNVLEGGQRFSLHCTGANCLVDMSISGKTKELAAETWNWLRPADPLRIFPGGAL